MAFYPPPPLQTYGIDIQQEWEEFNKERHHVLFGRAGCRPADSNRLALPPAIKRNVSINPEKRPPRNQVHSPGRKDNFRCLSFVWGFFILKCYYF